MRCLTIPFLANLTLDELNEIASSADILSRIGELLKEAECEPTFEMVPGRPLAVRLDVEFLPHRAVVPPGDGLIRPNGPWVDLPDLPGPKSDGFRPMFVDREDIAIDAADQMMVQTLEELVAAQDEHRAGAAPPKAAPELAEAAPPPAAEAQPVGLPDERTVGQVADAGAGGVSTPAMDRGGKGDQPVAAPIKAGKPGPKGQRPWTAEDDDRLVALMADARHRGQSMQKAAIEVSALLGRTPGATEVRSHGVLKGRIHDRMKALKGLAAQAAAKSGTENAQLVAASAEPTPVQGVVPATPEAPAPALDAAERLVIADPRRVAPMPVPPMELYLHLEQVPRGKPFDLQADRDLMRDIVAGIPLHVIADEFDMKPAAIEGRFDILTARRHFKREKVLEALEYMLWLANGAKAEAAE